MIYPSPLPLHYLDRRGQLQDILGDLLLYQTIGGAQKGRLELTLPYLIGGTEGSVGTAGVFTICFDALFVGD